MCWQFRVRFVSCCAGITARCPHVWWRTLAPALGCEIGSGVSKICQVSLNPLYFKMPSALKGNMSEEVKLGRCEWAAKGHCPLK